MRLLKAIATALLVITLGIAQAADISVKQFGATGLGVADDASAITKAIIRAKSSGDRVLFPSGTYKIDSEIAFDAAGLRVHFDKATITTGSNVSMVRFGDGAAGTSNYTGIYATGQLTIDGSGAANTSNNCLTIRNVAASQFNLALKVTDCGGTAFTFATNTRGAWHNFVGGGWDLTGNHALVIDINANGVGGFINDNHFSTIRAHANSTAGSVTHARIRGTMVENNTFMQVAVESATASDTLLSIEANVKANKFYGLRLDGVGGSNTALNINASAPANLFFGVELDGTLVDGSNKSVMVTDAGGNDFPLLRFGSSLYGANSWEIGIQRPGSTDELHVRYGSTSDGIVRFPNDTEVFFGNRSSGDNGPIEIVGEDKRVNLRTLPDTAIGSGPRLCFDGEFSSSGNMGTPCLRQVALNAVKVEGGRILETIQTFADGDTTPTISTGNVYIAANTGATTITQLDDPGEGQRVTIVCTESNTTLSDAGNLVLAGGFTCTPDDTITLTCRSSGVCREVSRSVN